MTDDDNRVSGVVWKQVEERGANDEALGEVFMEMLTGRRAPVRQNANAFPALCTEAYFDGFVERTLIPESKIRNYVVPEVKKERLEEELNG